MVKIVLNILITLTLTLYFCSQRQLSLTGYIFLIRVFIIFSEIIPISLRVNLDLAKQYHSWCFKQDIQLPNLLVRNSNIPEELGRIEILLSDKTGTLTENKMEVKKLVTS